MADVADQLLQQGFTAASGKPQQEATESVVGLVQKMQSVAQQRAQLDQMKQQMEEAKLTKFVDALDKGKTFKGAARSNYYKIFMPRMRDSLGLTDKFPDESLEFMTIDEPNMNRTSRIVAAVQEGTLTASRALEIVNDPVKFAQFSGQPIQNDSAPITEEEIKQINEAGKFAVGQATEREKNAATIQGAATRQKTDIETAGEQAIAKKAGEAFVEWQDLKPGVDSQLVKLNSAIDKLDRGEVKTGTGGLKAVSFWDAAQDLSHPEVASVRDEIRGAIQSTLKATMGNQFTEKEGTQLFNRAFNPRLDNAENVKRAKVVVEELKDRIAAKDALFTRQRFTRGQQPAPAPAAQPPQQAPNAQALGKAAEGLARALKSNMPNAVALFMQQAEAKGYTRGQAEKAIEMARKKALGGN